MSFSGFSDEDINQLGSCTVKKSENGQKIVTFKTSKTKLKKIPTHNEITILHEISDNIKLNDIKLIEDKSIELNCNDNNNEYNKQNDDFNKNKTDNINIDLILNKNITKQLEDFELKQKLMEEQNKKRKELLSKALADRTKRTQDEVQRLNSIEVEFKKLDVMLSNDVKILRKQIEVATFEFNECQKKYLKIEREFLDAKLQLHQKQEKKDLLTEHLCAIIEKNEERKATKLNELLLKLHLDPTDNSVNHNNGDITNN